MLLRRRAPAYRVLVPANASDRWNVYFVFLPNGGVSAAHLYTLDRLKAERGKLLVVCASSDPGQVPAALRERADALIWKALPGFDFSAYGLALRHLAEVSSGADVFVMNDSVLGPFTSPAKSLEDVPWDFTGFTASSLFENHVQSYAFQLRALTPARLESLTPVFPRQSAFTRYMDVVICQETRLARAAFQTMSVGARWFARHEAVRNLSLKRGAVLTGAGVPFVKKSLLDRYSGLQDRAEIAAILETYRHPLP
jgi:lipopolysaccharide biosynthesis protein